MIKSAALTDCVRAAFDAFVAKALLMRPDASADAFAVMMRYTAFADQGGWPRLSAKQVRALMALAGLHLDRDRLCPAYSGVELIAPVTPEIGVRGL